MKVEVIKNEEQEITYPCLMEAVQSENFVVYFFSEKEGVVLNSSTLADGHYSNDWLMESFKPFTGKLVLSNE